MIKIITNVLGPIQTDCYFVINEQNKQALIIDPACEADYIAEKCRELQIIPVAILLTHGHYDHTGGVFDLKQALNIPVYAGDDEKALLCDPIKNGEFLMVSEAARRGSKPVEADFWLTDNQLIEPAGFPVKIISAPGHTAGGICFYLESENVLFSGDVLFANNFGRTDLPTGNMRTLADSIINKLFVLPPETKVYPGHGESTDIAYEKANNPIYRYCK